MASHSQWKENDKVALCDVGGGDLDDVGMSEPPQDVQLMLCMFFPNLQRDQLCCICLLGSIVDAFIDSAIVTSGVGEREGWVQEEGRGGKSRREEGERRVGERRVRGGGRREEGEGIGRRRKEEEGRGEGGQRGNKTH